MSASAPAADLRLSCQPGKSGNALIFPYTLHNQGSVEVYVMDAIPSVDPETRAARADDQAAVVMLATGDDAVIGKFVAPLPTDRRMAVPTIPLAARLSPGATLERRLEIALPLAESSPYFADLPLRQYEVVDIKGVILTIGYWATGVDGLAAVPAEYAPDRFIVVTRNTARSSAVVTQRFPAKGLQLFKRKDAFPRQVA
jgi:hypothetical protein